MKRLFLVPVLALTLVAANVGKGADQELTLGVQAGINLGNQSANLVGGDAKSLLGFVFGLGLDYMVHENIYLAPELRFIQKGHKFDLLGTDVTQKNNYIEVPLLVKAKFGSPELKGVILAGPSVGLLMSAALEGADDKALYKTIDFGLLVGAGAEFAATDTVSLWLHGRYGLGLSNTLDSGADSKNKGIQILAGAQFAI